MTTLVVCGVPASGKSTLARALSKVLDLPVVTTRMARGQHSNQLATEDPDRYSKTVYIELGRLAAMHAASDGRVIVEGTFRRARDRPAFLDALEPHHDETLFVHCRAVDSTLQARQRQRAQRRRPSEPDVTSFDPLDNVGGCTVLVVHTEQSVSQLVAQVRAFL